MRWVSQDRGNAICRGKRGVYRIMRYSYPRAADGTANYVLLLETPHTQETPSTQAHLKTSTDREALKVFALEHDEGKA
jgi:hypothetical protein